MKDPGMKLYSSAGNRLTYTTKKIYDGGILLLTNQNQEFQSL